MKVIKNFFCIKTKKAYNIGDVYDGDRKDIDHLLEPKKKNKKAVETKKGAIEIKKRK